jgi:superfamily I DNA and RNA helicase
LFRSWAIRCGVDFSEGEEDGAFGERLLARLRGDAGLRGRYDAVLIDEAQDWPCSWFQCARLALKEPETGDLMIVGDGTNRCIASGISPGPMPAFMPAAA